MTGRERDSWFSGRVSLCFENEFKFQIALLIWEGFADDMEKFRGNLGRRKVNRT